MQVDYARTSTVEQDAGLAAQERDLRTAGCEKLFSEKVSSVAPRAPLEQALEFFRDGDVFMVCKPDRLARSTADLLSTVERAAFLMPAPRLSDTVASSWTSLRRRGRTGACLCCPYSGRLNSRLWRPRDKQAGLDVAGAQRPKAGL
jgi:Resolvase, N terminal domain